MKEVVGLRQKYRRVSEATKQFFRNQSEVLGNNNLLIDPIVSEGHSEFTNSNFVTPNVLDLSSSDTDDDNWTFMAYVYQL